MQRYITMLLDMQRREIVKKGLYNGKLFSGVEKELHPSDHQEAANRALVDKHENEQSR